MKISLVAFGRFTSEYGIIKSRHRRRSIKQGARLQLYEKRDSDTGVFLIAKFANLPRTSFLQNTSRGLLLNHLAHYEGQTTNIFLKFSWGLGDEQ